MKILLSGAGYISASIADKEDSGEIIEFPLMSDIDVCLDDEYYGSFDCDDDEYDDEMKVRIMPYVKENCLVKKEPPYFFRMVYGAFSWDVEFEIDDDDFDISKVELIRNDSSIEELNAFIVDNIIYDGKMIHCTQQSHDDIYDYEMSDTEIIETENL